MSNIAVGAAGIGMAAFVLVLSRMFDDGVYFTIQWTGVVFLIVSVLIFIYASVRHIISGAPEVVLLRSRPLARRNGQESSVEAEPDSPSP
jgi:Na+-transporting methylmalonyl-CoA/oxaloacetate decarboxylase gamma subunit